LQRNEGQKAQIRDRIKRAAKRGMGKIWRVGRRKFGGDWGRRLWLFDRLVWTLLSYGVEIWGWKEREGVKRIEKRFEVVIGSGREDAGVSGKRGAAKREAEGKDGEKAGSFERRLEEGRSSGLARICWEEMKMRDRKGGEISRWEKERRFF